MSSQATAAALAARSTTHNNSKPSSTSSTSLQPPQNRAHNTPSSTIHHDAGAALAGASIAFQKPKKPPALSTTALPRQNGALVAATMSASASARPRSRSPAPTRISGQEPRPPTRMPGQEPRPLAKTSGQEPPLSRHTTGGTASASTSTGSLQNTALDTRVSSVIAATLAARSASPAGPRAVPHTQMPPGMAAMFAERLSRRNSVDSACSSPDPATDTSSIGPTMSVVSLFEQRDDPRQEERGRPVVPRHRSSSPRKASSLRPAGSSIPGERARTTEASKFVLASGLRLPPRTSNSAASSTLESTLDSGSLDSGPAPDSTPAKDSAPDSTKVFASDSTQSKDSAPESVPSGSAGPPPTGPKLSHVKPKPPPPPSRHEPQQPPLQKPHLPPPPQRPLQKPHLEHPPQHPPRRPQTPYKPPRLTQLNTSPTPLTGDATPRQLDGTSFDTPTPRPLTATTASSDDTFVSAKSVPSSPRAPFKSHPASPAREPFDPPPILLRRSTSTIQLAPPPPPPPRRNATLKTPVGLGLDSTTTLDSLTSAIMAGSLAARMTPTNTGTTTPTPSPLPPRTKSPAPRFRETLRQPAEALTDDEADKLRKRRERNHKLRKRHAHHEGSRKRWRDEITARERRRYDAVWASNRGIYAADDDVANIVVRDIWSRSRLPPDELAEVWDLVDHPRRGALGRREFVVGMWLIDQRLKGRKIPTRVSESVWQSAGALGLQQRVRY